MMPQRTTVLAFLATLAATGLAEASPASRAAHMDDYLAIWTRNDAITPATVARLYGRRIDYYGHAMSNAAVFRDKLAFVRQWPRRSYAALPGSVSNDCSPAAGRCRIAATFAWRRADAAGRRESGTNSVRLDLAREDGRLKIIRESGAPVAGGR